MKLTYYQPPPESAHDLKKHLQRANVKIRQLQQEVNRLQQKSKKKEKV